ncbi:MAG: ATP phosphoribosyltransferase regulatory subunit [Methylocella sp.]|nr:MAG: ATP phosphoribosyltransferase regulatory subunit [Hyphomicrobiales bacterium]
MSFADQRAERIIALLTGAGYARCEPPILQPTSIFFDSGEELRGQLYLTSDLSGADYCLRPEYTIPVLAAYLATERAGESARFSYCGPVFRFLPGRPSEFTQAGIESFGRPDREAADAEILALALKAASAAKQRQAAPSRLIVRIGDAGLFSRLLEALDITPQWRRRIARGHDQGKSLDMNLRPGLNGADHSGVLDVLEGAGKQGARALVEDLLSIAGVAPAGGRSPAEIADRFLEQAALKAGSGFSAEKRAVIEQFLGVEGDPDTASAQLRALAAGANLDLSAVLDSFDKRLGSIAMQGLDAARLHFSARFTGNLDYYTGFVFEAHEHGAGEPLIGGGRYDQLPQSLGAKQPIPAIGAAIWIGRLGRAGAAP